MIVHNLATFAKNATYEKLSEQAVEQLKIRLLDSLGTAIGAVEGPPVQAIKKMIEDLVDRNRVHLSVVVKQPRNEPPSTTAL